MMPIAVIPSCRRPVTWTRDIDTSHVLLSYNIRSVTVKMMKNLIINHHYFIPLGSFLITKFELTTSLTNGEQNLKHVVINASCLKTIK